MPGAPPPEDEQQRLEALLSFEVLDTDPEESFDRITRLASTLLQAPIALVSLVDEKRQWFKSRVGLGASETPREQAFCGYAIHGDEVLAVPDATRDVRFSDNPLVTGPPHIRFYAGAPLMTESGRIGTLCIIDEKPRQLRHNERAVLEALASTVVDALELRRTLAVSRRRVQLLDMAQEVAGVGHWRTRGDSVYWSPQMHVIFGLPNTPSVAELVELFELEDRGRVREALAAARDGRQFDLEVSVTRATGERRRILFRGRPESEMGSTAVFGVALDVTEQRELQARLQHAEKMASVGTLAAGVAHEVNNPLSYIKANAELLAEEIEALAGASPSARLRELGEFVDEIIDGSRRIQRIVKGLRVFTRESDGRVEEVEIPRVLDAAVRLSANELRHKAQLEVVLSPDTPAVTADESQLVQVAVNLIVNAGHAIAEGDVAGNSITIRCGPTRDGDAFFEVSDTGTGMSDDVLRQAFTPFFTTKPQGVGTGLGLAICHGIVTTFGGTIECETSVGMGTTIRVVLPAGRFIANLDQASPKVPTSESTLVGRILLIDDEPYVARAMARLLRGHQVVVETDPLRALARLERGEEFDVLICDVMMPGIGSRELHEHVASIAPDLADATVFVTGGAFTEQARLFLDSEPGIVLGKPIEASDLRDAIAGLLARGR